jgi:hypothetical protein
LETFFSRLAAPEITGSGAVSILESPGGKLPQDRLSTATAPPLELKFQPANASKLPYVLTGFTHEAGFRVFAFKRMLPDRTWLACSVKADLALARVHGIHLQELPLMCRELLQTDDERTIAENMTFTDQDMRNSVLQRPAPRGYGAKKK